MDEKQSELVAKVPQVTFLFWIVKVLATTLGETAGDAVTMSWLGETTPGAKGTGYLVGTGIFGVIFIVAVLVQIRAKKFQPFLYWLTIVATTTVGTTLADYCTRSLGIGYTGGSTILLICVIASLLIWRWSPAVREYAAGISVDGTEQSAQRIIKTDNKHHCTERLQIFRHKTHPEFFAGANDKDGDEQDDEIALEPKESSEGFQRLHVRVLSDSVELFKSRRESKMRRLFIRERRAPAFARAISLQHCGS
jgi:Repeat of Unknown Function (DUF347)